MTETRSVFRPHRGSLATSMKEMIVVVDLQDLVTQYNSLQDPIFIVTDVYINPLSLTIDERINWANTYYVMATWSDGSKGVLGMSNFYEPGRISSKEESK